MAAINGSTTMNLPSQGPGKAPAARAAWREEMLGQILSSMRERKDDQTRPGLAASPELAVPRQGKGHYVDIYV